MQKKELTKQIILYLINKLGGKVEGKKKLMKLMFLLEYYDFDKQKLSLEKSLEFKNVFCIYHYGVFSLEIMECVNELIQQESIKDGFPLESKEKSELQKEEIKKSTERVVSVFGGKFGYQLEVETLKMMGIEPSEKKKYFGKGVKELIKN